MGPAGSEGSTVPALHRRMQGQHGSIHIPDLGALIANMSSWTLTRRGESENSRDPEAEFYDLHAVLSFVNEALFNDADYTKVVKVQLGKGQTYELIPQEGAGQRTALTGRNLDMLRVAFVRSTNG